MDADGDAPVPLFVGLGRRRQTAARRCRRRATRTRAPSTAARGIAATTAAARSRLNVRFRSAGPSASVWPVTTTRRRTPAWRAAASSCRSSATIAPSAVVLARHQVGRAADKLHHRRFEPPAGPAQLRVLDAREIELADAGQRPRTAATPRAPTTPGLRRWPPACRSRIVSVTPGGGCSTATARGSGHPRVERLIERPASFDAVQAQVPRPATNDAGSAASGSRRPETTKRPP